MRGALDALCGEELDATPAIWTVMATPLIPMVIAGLDARGQAAIERAMQLRYTTQVEQVIHRRHLLRNFMIGRGESRAIYGNSSNACAVAPLIWTMRSRCCHCTIGSACGRSPTW